MIRRMRYVIAVHDLERSARYYRDVLGFDVKEIGDHPDPSVRDFAMDTVKEVEVFNRSEESYGYVFYVLQRI